MTVEVATTIPGLNPSFPRTTDLIPEGAKHIRLIKEVLTTTFPNLDKKVDYSIDALNTLPTYVAPAATEFVFSSNFKINGSKDVKMGGNLVQNSVTNQAADMTTIAPTDSLNLRALRAAFRKMFPKGAVFCTGTVNINPANLPMFFGTGWAQVAMGRYIVGKGTQSGAFNFTLDNGGSTSFGLTASNIPNHTHTAANAVRASGNVTSNTTGNHDHQGGMGDPGAYWGAFEKGTNNDSYPPTRNTSRAISAGTGSGVDGNGNHTHTVNVDHTHSTSVTSHGTAKPATIPFAPSWSSVFWWQRTDSNDAWAQ